MNSKIEAKKEEMLGKGAPVIDNIALLLNRYRMEKAEITEDKRVFTFSKGATKYAIEYSNHDKTLEVVCEPEDAQPFNFVVGTEVDGEFTSHRVYIAKRIASSLPYGYLDETEALVLAHLIVGLVTMADLSYLTTFVHIADAKDEKVSIASVVERITCGDMRETGLKGVVNTVIKNNQISLKPIDFVDYHFAAVQLRNNIRHELGTNDIFRRRVNGINKYLHEHNLIEKMESLEDEEKLHTPTGNSHIPANHATKNLAESKAKTTTRTTTAVSVDGSYDVNKGCYTQVVLNGKITKEVYEKILSLLK